MGSEPVPNDPGDLERLVPNLGSTWTKPVVRHGTCRTVVLTQNWAFKLPWGLAHNPVRGWLANRSEWRQRNRPKVCRPRLSVGHVVLVLPRAICTGVELWGADAQLGEELEPHFTSDERKASSWGLFEEGWLLVDYDRCYEPQDRGVVGRLYWGNQERLARKWAQL